MHADLLTSIGISIVAAATLALLARIVRQPLILGYIAGGALRTPFGTFAVPELHEGERAVLCLRQRAIRIVGPGQGLEARVLHVKLLGDAALVEAGVQGLEAPIKALVRESEAPARGAEVAIAIDPERVLVFPAEAPENGGPPAH